jgi:hypothetical protein
MRIPSKRTRERNSTMITPLTERQQKLIVNNVVKACNDIDSLNKTGYNFLYLASGFIAHYNLGGFIAHYTESDLRSRILRNKHMNMWNNFRQEDNDYEYYMSKKKVYQDICERIA